MNVLKTRQLALPAVFCVVAATSAWLSGCSKPSAATIKASKFEYAILRDGIALNGKQARLPLSYTTLVKMIGKPSRTKNGENLIHTWDELGLLAYQQRNSKLVSEIHFCFKPDSSMPFSPEQPFAALSINGKTLNADSSGEDVLAAGFKKGDGFMRATIGRVKALCLFNEFAVPGRREAGLVNISCSSAK